MEFIKLVNKESEGLKRDIGLAVGASGLGNALLLVVINKAAHTHLDEFDWLDFLLYTVAMVFWVVGLKYSYEKTTRLCEQIICRVKTRIVEKIGNAEPGTIETIGEALIYNRLTRETEALAQSQQLLVSCLQAIVMLAFTSIYIWFLSPVSFMLIVVLFSALITIVIKRQKANEKHMSMANRKNMELFRLINDLLDGFKQIRVRSRLGEALFKRIKATSSEVRKHSKHAGDLNNRNMIFARNIFYVLLGAVVFILPRLVETHHEVIGELTAAVLFLSGPLFQLTATMAAVERANLAAANIRNLETSLTPASGDAKAQTEKLADRAFSTITLEQVSYDYCDAGGQRLFSFGPLDLELKSGEVLFIVGGNGSGKSTFLKLLTSLYKPNGGHIRVDDVTLKWNQREAYRQLFSVIFDDFRLFHRLYGLEHISQETVIQHIRQMQLTGKTDYDGTCFSELNLSTGQRKRVALLVSLLEDRPICVYDEWAADQDPAFRRYFYEQIVPDLKKAGKTVVAVTHDDQFFHHADRLVKLDYGMLEHIQIKGA